VSLILYITICFSLHKIENLNGTKNVPKKKEKEKKFISNGISEIFEICGL
jgi:hypothetical protein